MSFGEQVRLRKAILGSALVVALAASALVTPRTSAAAHKFLMYIGTYTDHGSLGIYVCTFDAKKNVWGIPKLAAPSSQPSFLAIAPGQRFLYAVNELNSFNGKAAGAVSAFHIVRNSGILQPLNEVSSLGPGAVYITLDRSGRFALVANYDKGSVGVFALQQDGSIGESTSFVAHAGSSVNHKRQEGPHAHGIAMSPDNHFALVADLGLDQILVYPFDAAKGALGAARIVKTDPGAGPRHLAFGKDGRFVYVVNELSSTVAAYSYDKSDAAMAPVQTISTLPEYISPEIKKLSTAAEIAVAPSGSFLYTTNRGDDSIAVFAIDPANGTLRLVEIKPTEGKRPRGFAIDPTGQWLMAANQDSDNIVEFRIDNKTGKLTASGLRIEVFTPVALDFVPL
jgi:6-phosphogluconolactonase